VFVARLAGLLAVAVLVAAYLAARSPYAQPQTFVNIGGRQLDIYCSGNGSPVVVLESGWGTSNRVWKYVFPVVARMTRVCSYDRAGLGFSDAGPMPRDADAIVTDLHALLKRAGVQPPYVVVGQSFGGLYARLYASRYPRDVAGMVLVDPTTDIRRFASISPAIERSFAAYLVPFEACAPTSQKCREAVSEMRSYVGSLNEVRDAAHGYGDLPLVVLTAGRTMDGPEIVATHEQKLAFWRLWKSMHDQIASQSSVGVDRVIERSGHDIQLEQPKAVVSAIDDVVAQARSPRR
jgi:pimeloyl-ACP methyl ester carboxylesterase